MGKQHQKLANKPGVLGRFDKVVKEAIDTLGTKHHLFGNKLLTYTSNAEGATAVTEEQGKLQSTVDQKLNYVLPFLAETINICHIVNTTNQKACADLIFGDTTLKNLPVITLMEIHKYVTQYKSIVAMAPTLDPAKGFEPDTQAGPGIYRAREVVRPRTQKEKVVITLSPATDKFAANVQLIDKDVVIGTTRQTDWSGMLTPAEKAAKLLKIERYLEAVTDAISRANDIETTGHEIGDEVIKALQG
jgi:hypothetical protein